jgi:uncharacterized RDD family membrane protein YckC
VSGIFPAKARALQGRRAGLVSRFTAGAIDAVVTLLAVAGIYFGFALIRFLWRPRRFSWPDPGAMRLTVLWWVLLVLYLTIAWTNTGRSVGKRVIGLRVVNVSGGRLGLPTAFLRALFCAAIPIGLFWAAVSRGNRSVQDIVLRTSVLYDWRLAVIGTVPGKVAVG